MTTRAYWLLTPAEKLKLGWITWNENFAWQFSRVSITPWRTRLDKSIYIHIRFWIQVRGFIRWAFNKPITFKQEFELARHHSRNAHAIDFQAWCKYEPIINA